MPGKETQADIQAAKAEVKEATSVNWDNVFSSITTGAPIKTAKAKGATKNASVLEPEPISMDLDAFAEQQAGAFKSASKNGADISPILYEINRYAFSSVNTQKDVEATAAIIREAIKKRIGQKVANNTKTIVAYASEFFQNDDGMRVTYNILGSKYSMKVAGELCGEECLYCTAQGNEIVGGVFLKDHAGELTDVSKKFKITINKL